MNIKTSIEINATIENVWLIISDIENSKKNIEGIVNIEVLEPRGESLVGLKWRETRVIFGKEADEIMWITDAIENKSYSTRAESHGAIYKTHFEIIEKGESCELIMSFHGESVSFMAKLFNFIFGPMMKKAMLKDLDKDLQDIKKAAEALQ